MREASSGPSWESYAGHRRLVVVVNGPPAAGKTTLARPLARLLEVALIEKDVIKEALFDSLGIGDVQWSRKLSAAAFNVMLDVAAQCPAVILDGNFRQEHRPAIEKLSDRPLEIYVTCSFEELVRRFAERRRSRHAGHPDLTESELRRAHERAPLGAGWPTLHVSTDQPVSTEKLREFVLSTLREC